MLGAACGGWKLKMKRLNHWFWFGILTCLVPPTAHAVERGKLPFAADLAAEARTARAKQMPILIMFGSSGCGYCAKVRDEFLIPTTLNADYDDKVLLLEVDVGSSKRMLDFNGNATTHARFAQRYRVGFTPTVVLLDAHGNELTDPLVGFVTADYYGGYLEDRLNLALGKLRK
jgi:thioredoxin-related protein